MSEGIIGTRIAHFAIVAKLGAGGMGVVYRAKDEKLGREVALKLLPPAFVGDADRRARFMREARSAAAVTHPNIATVHEVGEVDGRIYIAMELVEGQSLGDLVAAPLAIDRALSIARGIARGLAKAHERGIVHRDLKPDNVMIDGEGHVKVLDFGLAKMRDDDATPPSALGEASTVAPQTAEGTIVGTPGYMSPEQVVGRPIDVRSDVFSFGVLLYELATGVRPFVGTTMMEIAIKIERDPPRAPSSVNPAVSGPLEAVILRCLAKKPAERYANAREILAALEQIAPSATSGPTAEIALPPPARSRRGVIAAVVLGAVAVGALAWRATRPQTTATPSGAPSALVSASAAAAPNTLSENAEALKAYEAGLASRRLATGEVDVQMRRAIALDPDFAAAHLRLVGSIGCEGDLRKSYRAALAHEDKLSPLDRGRLDAYEAVCPREPPDMAEYKRRILALAEKYPSDADLFFDVAGVSNDPLAAIDRAIALDPGFANAYARRGSILAARGDLKAGILAYEKCLEISKGALKCQVELAMQIAQSGDCARLEVEARRAIAMGTDQQPPYVMLASALLAQGQPAAAAREALRQGAEKRAINRDVEDANVFIEILGGDFARALAMLADRARADEASAREGDHVFATEMSALVSLETGDAATVRRVARDYFAKQSGWEPTHGVDATASLLGALGRLGDVRAAEAFARVDKRIQAGRGPGTTRLHWNAWLAYTEVVFDSDGAALAMKALDGVPTPPTAFFSAGLQPLGHALALAGRADDAAHWLEKASRACNVLGFPLKSTWAHFGLGELREKSGDKAGACAAYRVVLGRWGSAKPTSTTAERARARVRALGCPGK